MFIYLNKKPKLIFSFKKKIPVKYKIQLTLQNVNKQQLQLYITKCYNEQKCLLQLCNN